MTRGATLICGGFDLDEIYHALQRRGRVLQEKTRFFLRRQERERDPPITVRIEKVLAFPHVDWDNSCMHCLSREGWLQTSTPQWH